MVQRDWPTHDKRGSIRIRALRGGTVAEITAFLQDLESAHDALFSFTTTLANLDVARRHARRFFPEEFLFATLATSSGFLPQASAHEIAPEFRLELSRVSIRSPGFWEFVGSLNPLEQIRCYLNDRHERRKDREYREQAEKERLMLDNELIQRQIWEKDTGILRERLGLLREFGGDDALVRQMVWDGVGSSLAKLGQHQDRGLIAGGAEQSEQDEDRR